MAKLTIKMLKNAGACAPELTRLKGLFGSSVKITEEFCVEHASECDWDWASKLLSPEARVEYDRVQAAAWEEFSRVSAPAWAERDRVVASARAEYERVEHVARAEYERVWDAARAKYDRVWDAARAEYDQVAAPAWARLWIQDHPTCKA